MIPVSTPFLGENEKRYLMECIESGWISSEGPFLKRFEEEFAAKFNRRHAIAVANGTAALDIAVAALGLGRGDEVIMPDFTIISCAAAVVRSGATPVLVDCDAITWNMDVTQIEAKITPNTRAIMVVHIYGLPVDMDPICELARKHQLKIIEDTAELIGQTYRQRYCGTFGDVATFSFYANKHITTGEGGMLLCDDEQLAEACRSFRNLCFQPGRRFVHEKLGWNYRMTSVQAAIGLAQLERLDEIVERKRAVGRQYNQLLGNLPRVTLPVPAMDYAENIYWVYGLLLDGNVPFDAQEAMRRLAEKGIGTRPFFWGMHEQPVFLRMGLFKGECYPNSARLARRGFYIPNGPELSKYQIEQVAGALHELIA